jgi:type III pantothenate kinase
MNLIFDIGNTFNKLAIYDRGKKVFSIRTKELSCDKIKEKISPFKIHSGIICSVKALPDFILDLISVNIPVVHLLSYKSKLPFKNEYETPETLGPDRLAAVAGALYHYPGEEILVIDAGSAITYDFLSGKKYKGGNISPGISMRFKALHKYTDKLPLESGIGDYSSPAKNTSDALKAGVITGVIYEINEYIRTFKKQHKEVKIILTGGDGEFLKDKISHHIMYLPDLVLDGLNYILEYNAK